MGIRTVVITGDNQKTADAVAAQVDVGDGIHDAPRWQLRMSAGLMDHSLDRAFTTVKLSRTVIRKIKNIKTASSLGFCYNIGIPIAAGLLYAL